MACQKMAKQKLPAEICSQHGNKYEDAGSQHAADNHHGEERICKHTGGHGEDSTGPTAEAGVSSAAAHSLSLQFSPARPNGHLQGTRRLKGHSVEGSCASNTPRSREAYSRLTHGTGCPLSTWTRCEERRGRRRESTLQGRRRVGLEGLTCCHVL